MVEAIKHETAGIISYALCHCPETLFWAFYSKSYGGVATQKELSQTAGLISKTASEIKQPGPKSMALRVQITPTYMHQPSRKSNASSAAVKDYTESSGCWDTQAQG